MDYRVGMTADAAVALARLRGDEPLRKPEILGKDKEKGYRVRWFYPGATLTLARHRNDGPYVVTAVVRTAGAQGTGSEGR